MKKLYGLNPMAPEFVPIACGNVLRAGQPLIASTSYNYHSMYAPPPYLPPPVPSAAPVTNLFSNQQQQSWFMQQQQQQQHGSPRRQQQATTPLASLSQSRTAYRPNRSMIAHPPPLGGVAGGRTKSAQHFGVGGGISAPSPPSINFNSSFNSSSPFAHLNSVFQNAATSLMQAPRFSMTGQSSTSNQQLLLMQQQHQHQQQYLQQQQQHQSLHSSFRGFDISFDGGSPSVNHSAAPADDNQHIHHRAVSKPLTVQQLEAALMKRETSAAAAATATATATSATSNATKTDQAAWTPSPLNNVTGSIWTPLNGPTLWDVFAKDEESNKNMPLYMRAQQYASNQSQLSDGNGDDEQMDLLVNSFVTSTTADEDDRLDTLSDDDDDEDDDLADVPLWAHGLNDVDDDFERKTLQFEESVLRPIRNDHSLD